jgi:hypothetical protein
VTPKLLAAAASRPSPELQYLLDVLERRIRFYRSKTVSLVSVQGAIQTELTRRTAIYGLLTSIGPEVRP